MTKEEIIRNYDPNGPGAGDNLFGLPFSTEHANLIVIPVPWEVTVSYGGGTAKGPKAILRASAQVDLYEPEHPDAWKAGVVMDAIPAHWQKKSKQLRKLAEAYIADIESGKDGDPLVVAEINAACAEIHHWVEERSRFWLEQGKQVAVLGGDHSTPLGLVRALASKHKAFGILHIDAHCDLRKAYEGFTYSHASIMYNVLPLKQVKKLVQVGIRDFCAAEATLVAGSKNRILMHTDRNIRNSRMEGETWKQRVETIVAQLPAKVYISFDIDGLDPKLCPGTGTPVPGGLEFEEAMYLIRKVMESGRTIIGFDLVEVASNGQDDWDANVGARVLWRMSDYCLTSQK